MITKPSEFPIPSGLKIKPIKIPKIKPIPGPKPFKIKPYPRPKKAQEKTKKILSEFFSLLRVSTVLIAMNESWLTAWSGATLAL